MSTPATPAFTNPPYLLRTPRLLLRCMGPDDAARRKESVDSSGEHLERFFSRTPEEPLSLEAHAAHIRKLRAGFDLDQDRGYGVFEPETERFLGEVSLLRRAGIDALEIGYWLRRDAVGQGFATEMASAAVKTAFELDRVKRMDLMCKPENERSAAVARRLGFTFEGRLRDRQLAPHHQRGDLLCFTLLSTEYPTSPASRLPLEAFDFLGRRLA
ncbi:GNAT family N-acetyltransferase [Archangium violaceum]|uniref:GNAT family N-acetyltransferase n=1 Tax=Archangium violaceum TaxID=83451 RepID=UPI00194E4B81|nr:GNAT family N-acetyltransferase [Archangium violaceum]QRN97817.1 GNAT family N-acetyltransferase [Archangium violaceum]